MRMRSIHIAANPALFYHKESRMAEVQFYEQFTEGERTIVAKLRGVKLLKDAGKGPKS